jgi:outer membrane receptor for ferrienterochelin and colicin/copper chaperone CopZ
MLNEMNTRYIKRRSLFLLLLLSVSTLLSAQSTVDLLKSVTIHVAGVCGMCEDRIEEAALKTKGVEQAAWDADSQQLTVRVDADVFEEGLLHFNVAAAGHDTGQILAREEVYQALPACCRYKDADNPHKQEMNSSKSMITQSFRVAGICGMCEDRIEAIANRQPGVEDAQWDAATQQLRVSFIPGEFDDFAMLKEIAEAGHETDLFDADAEAYAHLPACCQYKDENNPHKVNQHDHYEGYILGTVYEKNEMGELIPLIGANLYWENTTIGATTDADGNFKIQNTGEEHGLVVSYVGYETTTVEAPHEAGSEVDIILSHDNQLDVIEIVHRKKTTEISMIDPIKVHQIGEEELMKAACCNLSESFETNPSVDVSFTDAVTGTRQIEMLGLAGKYVQISRENMPNIRGLSAIHGLTYIPGPWIEGIQMNMGTGSVVNGYESMTGQINVELKKPEKSDRFYLNLFANQESRLEANSTSSIRVSDKVSTAVLLHGATTNRESDHNRDGFLDMPLGDQLILLNRWKYVGDNGMMGQFGIKATYVDKTSGQIEGDSDPSTDQYWLAGQKTNRLEAWMKMGRIFPARPYSSIGFQLQGVYHDQGFDFGLRPYDALQQSLYANLIYQSILGNTSHQYRTGVSFNLDRIDEEIADVNYSREETAPGAFFEYTFLPSDQFTLVGGLRTDWHNNYGLFFTPRMNIKYSLSDHSVIRAAAGRGLRTANIFAENIGFFASSRNYTIRQENPANPYGLDPEVAWNFGLNYTQQFTLWGRESVFTLDLYHTAFENQVVVDLETPGAIAFYNLDGRSFSNSIQAQLDMSLVENLDVRLAYRFNDARTQFDAGLRQKPLSAPHRAFINLAYVTNNGWKFDFTTNWQGQKRIPDTSGNPEGYRLRDYSPSFYLLNAQVTKGWNEVFEVYAGGENLLNFRQENPILAPDEPFGEYFDSSLVWGPVFGRKIYAGLRYRIK